MNTSTLARLSLALVMCLSASGSSLAQSDSKPAAGTNASKDCIATPSKCDLNATITEIVAPDSPAFAVLGLSSTNASNPNSPAELAAAALKGTRPGGRAGIPSLEDCLAFQRNDS